MRVKSVGLCETREHRRPKDPDLGVQAGGAESGAVNDSHSGESIGLTGKFSA